MEGCNSCASQPCCHLYRRGGSLKAQMQRRRRTAHRLPLQQEAGNGVRAPMAACCCFMGLCWWHHSMPVGLPHLAAELRRKIIWLGCFCQHCEPPMYVLHPSAAVAHPPWLLIHVCHRFLADPAPSIPCSAAHQHPASSCSSLLPGTFITWEHPACEVQLTRFGKGGHNTLFAFRHTAGDGCAGSLCEVGAQSLQAPSQAPFLK